MCWNLWTFIECGHKQAERTLCGRRCLLCRTINRDALIDDRVCYNCNLYCAHEVTEERWYTEICKAEALYYYIKGLGGDCAMLVDGW